MTIFCKSAAANGALNTLHEAGIVSLVNERQSSKSSACVPARTKMTVPPVDR